LNIEYLDSDFNNLCGFTEAELQAVLLQLLQLPPARVADTLSLMRTFYNGYCFNTETFDLVYNPTLAIYFLEEFQKRGRPPRTCWTAIWPWTGTAWPMRLALW
jgi:hypothetical protein